MSDNEKPIKTLTSRIDWESPWYRVRRDEIVLPDGKEGVYNVLEMLDSVFIVPITAQGEIVLIRNYRHTLHEWIWELPAGGIKAGQTPQEAAADELLEEVGGTAKNWKFLLKAATMNGIGNHSSHFFIAWDVILGEPQPEVMGFMTIHTMPAKEALTLAKSGEMNDALSICALLLAESHLEI